MPRTNDFLQALRAEVERQLEKRVTPLLERLRSLGRDLRNAQRELAGMRITAPAPPAKRASRRGGSGLAASVRDLRKQLGLSQAAFAKLAGVSLNSVGLWESGRTIPGPENTARIEELSQQVAKGGKPSAPKKAAAPKKRARRKTAAKA